MRRQYTHLRPPWTRALMLLAVTAVSLVHWPSARAADGNATKAKTETPRREIFVPFEDLNVLLQQQPKRMLLSRQEYEALLKEAETKPESHAPLAATMLSGDYSIDIKAQRSHISGRLEIDVLEDGLHAVPLNLGGVGLLEAKLDGKPAAIGGDERSGVKLFVRGKGRHELTLRMVTPLQVTAARQVLNFRLPRPPVASMNLTIPGDVEIKSGATVVSRQVDEEAGVTRFRLLPNPDSTALVMTLNSHLRRKQEAVIARSVLIDEVTESYEKLHATVSLDVPHKAVDRFRFRLPQGFKVTEVSSELLSRWLIEEEGDDSILVVELREPTTGDVLLSLSAIKTPNDLDNWTMPRLEPLDVVSQTAIVGLLMQQRLSAESIAAEGLIAIRTATLAAALPQTLQRVEPGTPQLQPVVAYYAPQPDFSLSASFKKPPAKMAVTTNLLLVVSDAEHEILGGLAMLPRVEKRFGFDFSVPAGWHVLSVTGADEKPLAFERYGEIDKPSRIRVKVPQGIPVGKQYKANFQARRTPSGWLDDWRQKRIFFPRFTVADTASDIGAVAVAVRDDMTVRPEKIDPQQLVLLEESEKAQYGLAGVATNLAYRYEKPDYEAELLISRTTPRLTARTYSFLSVNPEALSAHFELEYDVDEARTRRLVFSLPEDTPQSLTIRGLDGLRLKQYDSRVEEGRRVWTAVLAQPTRGTLRLAVDFKKRLPNQEPKDFALPVVRAEGVAYQSGVVAVEGNVELDVQVKTKARREDVGELVDADYRPGRRLLGVFGFVGETADVAIDVFRHPGYGIQTAIVENAILNTHLSAEGPSQTEARFSLRTKALLLEVKLPAESQLWSAQVDGKPIKPQREGDSLLVSLPATAGGTARQLKFVYETPLEPVGFSGNIDVPAPRLLLPSSDKNKVEVPLADLSWNLFVPPGYEVTDSAGTLETTDLERPLPAAVYVAGAMYQAAGGINGYGLMRAAQEVSKAANRSNARMRGKDGTYYGSSDEWAVPPAAETVEEIDEMEGMAEEMEQLEEVVEVPETATEVVPEDPPAEEPATEPVPVEPAVTEPTIDEAPSGASGIAPGYGDFKPGTDKDGAEKKPATPFGPGDAKDLPPTLIVQKPEYEKAEGEQGGGELLPPTRRSQSRNNLRGIQSLKITLAQQATAGGQEIKFASLGVEPRLSVTLANRQRFRILGLGLAMLVVLAGVVLSNRSARVKCRFVIAVLLLATLIPLAVDSTAVAWVCNMAFFAASLLVPYYLLLALLRKVCSRFLSALGRMLSSKNLKSATAALLLVAVTGGLASAQSKNVAPAPKTVGQLGRYVIEAVETLPKVSLPEDAIVLPYDPKSKDGIRDADRMLVPYAQYVELWNRAHPDKKIGEPKAPVPYSLAGVSYTTTAEGDEYLLVDGTMQIDVFTDEFVSIPLPLAGGVLSRAELDGKQARLSIVRPNNKTQQAAQKVSRVQPPAALATLHVEGKGRHTLEFSARMTITRQGGWRVVRGNLPYAGATSLAITVPKPQTELRIGNISDRQSYETEKPDETITTALNSLTVARCGLLNFVWRPKVAEGEVDRSLTAQSKGLFDIEEDGLRMLWCVKLEFPRGQREQFTVNVPPEYMVETVRGGNVRGWQSRREEGRHSIDVVLLGTATESETLMLRLSKSGAVGSEDMARFEVPAVTVPDAALHEGTITIRHSPLLELRATDSSGVERTNLSDPKATFGPLTRDKDKALGIRSFQAYRFTSTPFKIGLAAEATKARVTADVQSILYFGEYTRSLETQLLFDVSGRPIFRVQAYLPEGFELEQVIYPGQHRWAITEDEKGRLLSVYLADGRQGQVAVRLTGTLGKPGSIDKLALPTFELLDVQRQSGDTAVQVNPEVMVEARELRNCESVLADRLYGWLNPGQRELTRLALRHKGADYGGTLLFTQRKPLVSCTTVTNVQVTDRIVKETIVLKYNVRHAGTDRLSFSLPASMADCRISVPKLRQKTIKPSAEEGGPLNVSLELQEKVMGEVIVLVENDRLLSPKALNLAPIPTVTDGRTDRRFVVIESAGGDEVVVEPPKDLEALGRQQREWATLRQMLGSNITKAYIVGPDAESPRLAFKVDRREAVQTAGARIELAATVLVVDAAGAYRASMTLKCDNTTEQFLLIKLPVGARLWTARVAGQPVKPVTPPGKVSARLVRIPLIKMAAGDLDFDIVLKYGGKIPSLGKLSSVNFPLIHTENIKPELSQVKLCLPESYKWFDFGGTMSLVTDEADLEKQRQAYINWQGEKLLEISKSGDEYAQVRALGNYKSNQTFFENKDSGRGPRNKALQAEYDRNAEITKQMKEQIRKQEVVIADQSKSMTVADNRDRLNDMFDGQKVLGTTDYKNVAGSNWQGTSNGDFRQRNNQAGTNTYTFNDGWLESNSFQTLTEGGENDAQVTSGTNGTILDFGGGVNIGANIVDMPGNDAFNLVPQGQPMATSVAQGKAMSKLTQPQQMEGQSGANFRRGGKGDKLSRYQQEFEQQQRLQQQAKLGKDFSSGKPEGKEDRGEGRDPLGTPRGDLRRAAQQLHRGSGSGGVLLITDGTIPLSGGVTSTAGEMYSSPTGLASLDVEIPTRGAVYNFTVPRGEVEVTARAASRSMLDGLYQLGLVLVVVAVIGCLLRLAVGGRFGWLAGPGGSTLLICLGLLCLVLGFFQIASLAAIAAGIYFKVRRGKPIPATA